MKHIVNLLAVGVIAFLTYTALTKGIDGIVFAVGAFLIGVLVSPTHVLGLARKVFKK